MKLKFIQGVSRARVDIRNHYSPIEIKYFEGRDKNIRKSMGDLRFMKPVAGGGGGE